MISDRFDHLCIHPRDFEKSKKFYREALGWQVVREWKDDHGNQSVILSGGGIRLMLVESHDTLACSSKTAATDNFQPHAPTLHLDIHDVNKRFAQIPAGDHVVQPPQDNRWGTRWFVLKDPDGNLIAFNEMRQKS